MIWIRFDGRLPTDTDIPGWTAWTDGKWIEWLKASSEYVDQMALLTVEGKIKERGTYIDSKASHWRELEPWLSALSKNKCWFSEAKELYSYYHVEHFRPKKSQAKVDGQSYWWLSFDYKNFRLCGAVGNSGKGAWFPLRHGSTKGTFEQLDHEEELYVFIDPTKKEDVALAAYDETGDLVENSFVPQNFWTSSRVRLTSHRLRLFEHVLLAEERRKVWRRARELVEIIDECANYEDLSHPAVQDRLNDTLKQIERMVSDDEQLSGTARWAIVTTGRKSFARMVPLEWLQLIGADRLVA